MKCRQEARMPGQEWNLQRGSEQYGPFSWEEVVELARQGRVEPADLVWRTGDPASRQARDVPGLLTVPVPAKRWLGPAMIGAVALLVVVLTVIGSSDDDIGGSSHATDPDTTEISIASTTTVPPTSTTAPEATTSAATTTTTSTTTTVAATTTTLAIATVDDLVAALPDTDNLQDPYASPGGTPDTDMTPRSGVGSGACGLANMDLRAQQNEVVAAARAPDIYTPEGGILYLAVFSFPGEAEASGFVQQIEVQSASCPAGIAYDIVEGDGEDQWDIFTDGYGDNEAVWHMVETDTPGTLDPGEATEADQRYLYRFALDTSTNYEGVYYHTSEDEWDLYERYGSVVIVFQLYGVFDPQGFDPFDAPVYQPTVEALLTTAADFRPGMLAELRSRGVIP
jgi:hypothetical protein